LAKAFEALFIFIRPINGTAMNFVIIAAGFSQRIEDYLINSTLAQFSKSQ